MTKPPNAWRGSREWPVSPAAYPLNPSKPKGETYCPEPVTPASGIRWVLAWFGIGVATWVLILGAIYAAMHL